MTFVDKSADLKNPTGTITTYWGEPIVVTENDKKIWEEIAGRIKLYDLLAEGLNDIKVGNVLSEDEMDESLDMM